MKGFIKGVRFTPPNYSDEIGDKIQKYRKQGYRPPPRKVLRTPEQIEGIHESVKINAILFDHTAGNIHEGTPTKEINRLIYDFTTAHGAIPVPLNCEGSPKGVCTSINDMIHHGISSPIEFLQSGDTANVDISTIYKGYLSDVSRMFMVGEVSPEKQRLIQVTRECVEIGIAATRLWIRLGDVGAAIQEHAEKNGYSMVRDSCGHGVGIKFHKEPDVRYFEHQGTGTLILPGTTFTIESIVNMGVYEVFADSTDDWTVRMNGGSPSAQWENMILTTETGNEILTY